MLSRSAARRHHSPWMRSGPSARASDPVVAWDAAHGEQPAALGA